MTETKPLSDLLPTRDSLLSRLRDLGDETSWSEFFHIYWRLIYEVALKSGLGEADAEEVVQETAISVAKKMPGFRYDPALGKFKGWLLQITRRRIADQLRKQMQANGATGQAPLERVNESEMATLLANSNFEAIWDEEWEKHLFNTAVANVKKQVRPEHYQLFNLYVMQKWPIRKIADTLGVNSALIYLSKHRISKLLKTEIASIQKKQSESF